MRDVVRNFLARSGTVQNLLRRRSDQQLPRLAYTVELEEDTLDGGWIASVVEVPGCMSQGDTEEEAIDNVRDALSCILQAGPPLGDDLRHPSPPRGRTHRHVVSI